MFMMDAIVLAPMVGVYGKLRIVLGTGLRFGCCCIGIVVEEFLCWKAGRLVVSEFIPSPLLLDGLELEMEVNDDVDGRPSSFSNLGTTA